MILDLDGAALTVLCTVATGIGTAIAATIRHLYVSREEERNARLSDASQFTAAMLDVQARLRAEDAKEIAELRAKVDHYADAPPSRPSRRRPRS